MESIRCGVIYESSILCEVFCNLETGELFYTDGGDFFSLIDGVIMEDPRYLEDSAVHTYAESCRDYIGIVLSQSGTLYILNDSVAEFRHSDSDVPNRIERFEIDLSGDYVCEDEDSDF